MSDTVLILRVRQSVASWHRWVARWEPPTHRARPRVCRKCTGSPIAKAAGFSDDTPHQVIHALVGRLHRIIDQAVDEYTEAHLPVLQAELDGAALWNSGGYDPSAGLDAEYDGVEVDPPMEDGAQPVLFTFAELAESTKPEPALPRPPLNDDEKRQLRREIELADQCAVGVGQEICFMIMKFQQEIRESVQRFVDPQVDALLEELSRNLEPPGR